MEAALRRLVEERSRLEAENRGLSEQLRQTGEVFVESERVWKRELRQTSEQLVQARSECERLRSRESSRRTKSKEARKSLEASLQEVDRLTSQLREKTDLVRRLEQEREIEQSRTAAVVERLEREVLSKEEWVTRLQEEIQELKLKLMSEHVPLREYERVVAQHEKLSAHSQIQMVPLDQHNKLLDEVTRLQDTIRESVPKKDYLSVFELNQSLVEKQSKELVSRDRYDALERDFSEFKSKSAKESVPLSKWNSLSALNKKLLKRMEEECISMERYERMREDVRRLSEDRRLLEESARVLEEEKEGLLRELAEKTRELDRVKSKLTNIQSEYSSLSVLVPESNATIESLRDEICSMQCRLLEQRELTMRVEAEKGVLAVQVSELKLKLKQMNSKRVDAEKLARESEIEIAHVRGLLDGANERARKSEERSSRLELEVENFLRSDRGPSFPIEAFIGNSTPPISPLRPNHLHSYSNDSSGMSLPTRDNEKSILLTPIKTLDERIREYQEQTKNSSECLLGGVDREFPSLF